MLKLNIDCPLFASSHINPTLGLTCVKMEPQNSHKNGQIAVLMVPFPAQGHLNQLLHFSHLLTSNNISVHYAGSTTHNHQAKLRLHGRDAKILTNIHFHDLELPLSSSPPPNPNPSTHFPVHFQPIFDASLLLREPVCQLLHELAPKFKRVVVIHDNLMGSVVQDVKSISNAEAYNFVPVSALAMCIGILEMLPDKPFQLLDFDFPISKIPSQDDCLSPEATEFLRYQHFSFSDFQSGILYDTCRLIEGKYVQLLERLSVDNNQKYFAIGPLNPVGITKERSNNAEERSECLDWLDKQEPDSVIYVSFGSITTVTEEQIEELAKGLETSGHKFIWVLRKADDCGEEVKNPKLPQGYEDRVKSRGIIVKDWAPQLEILSHPSTGGFMSHCGWNSCMESITMGVPMATWPMHSDQPRNSILVTEVLKIGITVRDWENRTELVRSNYIENIVRRLMASKEGGDMRKRAAELGEKVRGSAAKGGASHSEMESFIAHITR